MDETTKKYTNGEVTVIWQPSLCIHSAKCFKGLGEVFDPKKRPWITLETSTTDKIIEQVKKCPSGALDYILHEKAEETVSIESETIIEPTANGPLLVYGNVTVKNSKGESIKKSKVTAFCRCGASGNKPYCDGTHGKITFLAD
jgi:uncharacterized Fe-S cluster protein YjdI